MPTLTLIDGSGFVFRAFHAIPHLSTTKGQPTNAVYGFTTMLLKALREHAPTHVALVIDASRRSFRTDARPDLQGATAPRPPEDLVRQFPLVREVARALDVPVLEEDGRRGRRRHRHPGPARARRRLRGGHRHRRQGLRPARRRGHRALRPDGRGGGAGRLDRAGGRREEAGRAPRPGDRAHGAHRGQDRQRPRRPGRRRGDGGRADPPLRHGRGHAGPCPRRSRGRWRGAGRSWRRR